MAAWILCFALIGVLYVAGGDLQVQERTERDQATAQSVGRNLAIYRVAVEAYYRANPTTTGEIPDGALGLPGWFRKHSGVGNLVSAGRAYVYYAPPAGVRPALSSFLAPNEGGPSLLMGIVRGGWLVSPRQAAATIQVPPTVPDGAIVFVL